VAAATAWRDTGQVQPDMLKSLEHAADAADAAVNTVRSSAIAGATALSWSELVRGSTRLDRADGSAHAMPNAASQPPPSADRLGGKIVALYFTASWCGPCHRFTPKLAQLYNATRAGASSPGAPKQATDAAPPEAFEVIMVSWDESEAAREAYARSHGMKWLALPHISRELADTLALRYEVRAIPSLVVLEISADGTEARLLSQEGRWDVESGKGEWLARLPGATGGGWLSRLRR